MRHFIFDLKYFCSLKIPFNNMAVQKGFWWKRKWMRQFYILFSSIRTLYFCLRCDVSLQCHLPDILSDANTRKRKYKNRKSFLQTPRHRFLKSRSSYCPSSFRSLTMMSMLSPNTDNVININNRIVIMKIIANKKINIP